MSNRLTYRLALAIPILGLLAAAAAVIVGFWPVLTTALK
jgi:hypothetical protein